MDGMLLKNSPPYFVDLPLFFAVGIIFPFFVSVLFHTMNLVDEHKVCVCWGLKEMPNVKFFKCQVEN